MNKNERMELNSDIETAYKGAILPLYLKHKRLGNAIVGEMFYFWVCKHYHDKSMAKLNKQRKKKDKAKLLQKELDQLKADKGEVELFEEICNG
jgi:hypothetical protein